MVPKSHSSAAVPLADRARYYRDLFRMYRQGGANADLDGLREDFERIDACVASLTGRKFAGLVAVEIGFGSKPYRIMYFNSRGVDAFGIDMDQPVLTASPAEFASIARKNGLLRAVKSFVRYFLFERSARRKFLDDIRAAVPGFVFDTKRLVVGDAGLRETWNKIPAEPEVIYSMSVFEHIRAESLLWLLEFLRQYLPETALLYLVVSVYTGLTGSHLTEWFPHRLAEKDKRSEPWEHLRRNRFQADTYLNKMTRRQYVSLFSQYFDVLEDKPVFPDLGREFLTEAVRRELASYDEYELLSNDVLFVLRPKNLQPKNLQPKQM